MSIIDKDRISSRNCSIPDLNLAKLSMIYRTGLFISLSL